MFVFFLVLTLCLVALSAILMWLQVPRNESKKRRRLMLMLIVLGGVIGSAYSALDEVRKMVDGKVDERLERLVQEAKSSAEAAAEQAETAAEQAGKSVEKGDEILLRLATLGEFERVAVQIRTSKDVLSDFSKGTPPTWERFAEWLRSVRGSNSTSALTVELGQGRTFRFGLLLAYLLTNETNQEPIRAYMYPKEYPYATLTIDELTSSDYEPAPNVKYVLFAGEYPIGDSKLVGYCSAAALAKELIALQNSGRHHELEAALNVERTESAVAELQGLLDCFETDVFRGPVLNIVQTMLERNTSQGIAETETGYYQVSLKDLVSIPAVVE